MSFYLLSSICLVLMLSITPMYLYPSSFRLYQCIGLVGLVFRMYTRVCSLWYPVSEFRPMSNYCPGLSYPLPSFTGDPRNISVVAWSLSSRS